MLGSSLRFEKIRGLVCGVINLGGLVSDQFKGYGLECDNLRGLVWGLNNLMGVNLEFWTGV